MIIPCPELLYFKTPHYVPRTSSSLSVPFHLGLLFRGVRKVRTKTIKFQQLTVLKHELMPDTLFTSVISFIAFDALRRQIQPLSLFVCSKWALTQGLRGSKRQNQTCRSTQPVLFARTLYSFLCEVEGKHRRLCKEMVAFSLFLFACLGHVRQMSFC